MEYPKPHDPPQTWIDWYQWKTDAMDRTITMLEHENALLKIDIRRLSGQMGGR